MPAVSSTLALVRRAFFVVASSCLAVAGPSPTSRQPAPLAQTGKLDQNEARAALEELRHLGIAGNYYLEFQLRVMPRRGEERLIKGKLWGGRDENGTLSRVSLALPTSQPGVFSERRLLIQSGPHSAAWRWDAGGGVQILGVSALFEPLVTETEITAFDLQMPYVYWEKFVYEGITRFRGRPAYVLLLKPPAEFLAKYPALSGVRVYLDTQYSAPMQTQLLGADGAVLKTIAVVDLKRVGEQWIPKSSDARDEATHNKTRMTATGVALKLEFAHLLFEPTQLTEDIRPPAASQIVSIEP
jgi:hypothetical protein